MKKIIVFLLFLTFVGCSFIYSENDTVKSVGLSRPAADQVLDEIQQKPDDEKIKIWPRQKKD